MYSGFLLLYIHIWMYALPCFKLSENEPGACFFLPESKMTVYLHSLLSLIQPCILPIIGQGCRISRIQLLLYFPPFWITYSAVCWRLRPRWFSVRVLLCCRHRAVNLFLQTYSTVWLDEENTGQEVLIEDLTVSARSAMTCCKPMLLWNILGLVVGSLYTWNCR